MFFFDDDDSCLELLETLKALIDRWENEIVEFKEANRDYDKDKIGQYVSAISNEANLKEQRFGWLIFGIRNKDRCIVGTSYRLESGLEKLRQEIADGTGGITFLETYVLFPNDNGEKKRVIMFQIPAAVTAMPTPWHGHYYSRNGESLTYLALDKLERIRGQQRKDWSKLAIEGSSIEHLDKSAIAMARENYKKKQNKPHISEEIDRLSDEEFLIKNKLIIDGKLTNAAMVLLGNSDYDYLMDTLPRIMWRLYGSGGVDKDYAELTIPFITVVDKVYEKIRNLTYRYMPNQMTLFPTETQQYDSRLLRELLNNCIAHQNYTIGGRIYINEFEDQITITNPGSFLPGNIRNVLQPGYTSPYYRNQLLADVMVRLNMIDTAAMGIRMMFNIQKNKYFPLPDYDVSDPQKVAVTIYGKVIDENYTKVLFNHRDFDLDTVYLIDRVQKRLTLEKQQVVYLRKLGVIEGKAPHVYVSASVAEIIDDKARYIKNRGFDDKYYKDMILDYLRKFEKANRHQINDLLLEKLPDSLNQDQKNDKVMNLLTALKKAELIDRDSANQRSGNWVLKR